MNNEALRRAVHMCAPLFALAYLLPEDMGVISRDAAVIIAWSLFALFEAYRIKKGIPITGLRDYEYKRPSAAFWMCSAFLPMILFFPVDYALPLLIGFGFTDPLCGLLRKKKVLYPIVPFVVYLMIMMISLSISYDLSLNIFVISIAVTTSAIVSEAIKNRMIDDDFLMLAVPLVVLWIFGMLLL